MPDCIVLTFRIWSAGLEILPSKVLRNLRPHYKFQSQNFSNKPAPAKPNAGRPLSSVSVMMHC